MRGYGGYLLFRLLAGFLGVFSESIVRHLGYALGYWMWATSPRKRRMAERHMRRALGPGGDAASTARRMFQSYGRYWAEVFWMRQRRFDSVVAHADVVGRRYLDQALAQGRPVIYALPHVGNWEAAGARSVEEGFPVTAVAEALANRRIRDWFVRVRNTFGIEVVIAEKGVGVTRKLLKRLSEGRTLALPCDRDLKGQGVEVEFFGEKTTLPPGPAALADRTNALLLPVGCYFKKRRGHRLVVYPPIEVPQAESAEERVAAVTQELAYVLEDIIRAAPEQWHITQPNWPSDRNAA